MVSNAVHPYSQGGRQLKKWQNVRYYPVGKVTTPAMCEVVLLKLKKTPWP
jgi:hypothetical protein